MTAKSKNSRKKYLKADDPVPDDIHWEWLEVIKAAQAACKDNGGFAKLTLVVSVIHNKPMLWAKKSIEPIDMCDSEPPQYELLKISPKRVAEWKMSSELVAALMAICD